MNKTWIFAAMALALGTSCSKDKGIDIDDSSRQEILLGTGSTVSVSRASRGYGAVGGTDEETNKWNGETVYVYGINNTATGDAKFAINAQEAKAPSGAVTGTLTWVGNNVHYYYNGNDLYDFYAVHVNDAVSDAANALKIAPETDLEETPLTVDLTLNGTQDIMVAVPDKEKDIENNDKVTDTGKLYSAWSSRRDVKPNLVFTHLLTRLNFMAMCGNTALPEVGKEIKITKIEVLDVFNKATLSIIPEQKLTTIAKDPEAPVNFELMKEGTGDLVAFDSHTVSSNTDFEQVGANMLVCPESAYKAKIYLEQDSDGDGEIKDNEKTNKTYDIALTEGKVFEAGYMYNIKLTVYSLERIDIEATLKPWVQGDDVNIGQDEITIP